MKSLYEPATFNEIINRLNQIKEDSSNKWGKMNSSQMMAHCSAALIISVGDSKPPRSFIGLLIGRFVKKVVTSEEPYKPNLPTDKSFIIKDKRNFGEEKTKLISLINRFHTNGAQGAPTHPHPFFGKLSPAEWNGSMYKHLDHHLRQFGV